MAEQLPLERIDENDRGGRKVWIVQYECGCTDEAAHKRDLLEYCGIHGDDVQVLYPPRGTPRRKHG